MRHHGPRGRCRGDSAGSIFHKVEVMTTLICPESPWSSRSVQMTVPSRLDERDHRLLDMSRTLTWGIELTSGEHCISIKSDQYFDGLRVHYQCDNNIFLLGAPQRCATTWTILRHDNSGMSMVNVYKAWF